MNIHERLRMIREGDIVDPSGDTLDFTITDENEFRNSSWIIESYELFESLSGFDKLLESSDQLFVEAQEEFGNRFKIFISYIKEKIAKFLNWMMDKFKGSFEAHVDDLKRKIDNLDIKNLSGTISYPEGLMKISDIEPNKVLDIAVKSFGALEGFAKNGTSPEMEKAMVDASRRGVKINGIREDTKQELLNKWIGELFHLEKTKDGFTPQGASTAFFGNKTSHSISSLNLSGLAKALDTCAKMFKNLNPLKTKIISELGQLERAFLNTRIKGDLDEHKRRGGLAIMTGTMDALLQFITTAINIFWRAMSYTTALIKELTKKGGSPKASNDKKD